MDIEKTDMTDDLLLRCIEGQATAADFEEAGRWVHAAPENREHYLRLHDAWMAAALLKPVEPERQQRVWNRLENKLKQKQIVNRKSLRRSFVKANRAGEEQERRFRIRIYRWMAVAAAIAVAYGIGSYSGEQNVKLAEPTARQTFVVEAPKGGKSLMTLSDGTKVWLNAGSSLKFSPAFGVESRQLSLTGEAYFEVAHDSIHPFTVDASGITIAALGTAFNVKAYADDKTVEATLVEGSIRVQPNADSRTSSEAVVLKPNQKIVYYKTSRQMAVSPHTTPDATAPKAKAIQAIRFADIRVMPVDADVAASWKSKRWTIEGQTMADVAKLIERRYDVEIIFDDKALLLYKISATLEEETIEQLLRAIRLTVPMDYRIKKDTIYLSINEQLKEKYDRLINNNVKP